MTARSANHLAVRAQRLSAPPVCAEAYGDGRLSGGQIDAIVAVLDDQTAPGRATTVAGVSVRAGPRR